METIRTNEIWKVTHQLSRLLHTLSVKGRAEPMLYTVRYQSVLVITRIIDAQLCSDTKMRNEQYHRALVLLTQIEYLSLLLVETGALDKYNADEVIEHIWQARHLIIAEQQEPRP